MATFGNYEIDGPNLASATTVFGPCPAPPTLCTTVIAPDGYYSDGTTVRLQIGGVLQSPENCATCGGECDGNISVANGGKGQFLVSVNTGGTTGAVRIEWNVLSVPDGFRALWNGNIYNKQSTVNYGYMNDLGGVVASLTEPLFTGLTGAGTGCAPLPCAAPCAALNALPVYEYLGGSWNAMGTTVNINSINSAEIKTQPGNPGTGVLYIPKTSPGPSNIDIEMYGVCDSTAFNVTVFCVAALTGVDTSVVNATQVGACGLAITTTLYTGPVTGTPGVPGLHDWVFTNPDSGVAGANTYAAAGYYKYNDGVDKWFRVSSNGVIDLLGTC